MGGTKRGGGPAVAHGLESPTLLLHVAEDFVFAEDSNCSTPRASTALNGLDTAFGKSWWSLPGHSVMLGQAATNCRKPSGNHPTRRSQDIPAICEHVGPRGKLGK